LSEQERPDWVTVAKIVRPRGNRGEVLAVDLCEDDRPFEAGTLLSLLKPDGSRRQLKVEFSWRHGDRLVLKLEGVDSIGDAEALRDCEAQLTLEELGPPPEGEHYYFELVGCEVREEESDRLIGRVEAIQEPGGPILLEVRTPADGEVLIPFRHEICVEIAPAQKRIRVRLPEGLEDLNP